MPQVECSVGMGRVAERWLEGPGRTDWGQNAALPGSPTERFSSKAPAWDCIYSSQQSLWQISTSSNYSSVSGRL